MNDFNMKSIKEDFKKKGIFYTPKEMGEYFKTFIDVPYQEVYDPTCGHGNLLSVFGNEIKKYGQEINGFALEAAYQTLTNFHGELGDTITEDKFKGKEFDLILANPPFSIKYDPDEIQKDDERFAHLPCFSPPSKADFMFIFHCIAKLKQEGQLIILNFPGICYRGAKEKTLRQYLIEQNYIEKVVLIGGDKFVDTKIQTVLLIIKKNKTTTDIEFINQEKELTRTVTMAEIIEEDHSLNVQNYIQEEIIKEEIDPIALQNEAHEALKHHIQGSLIFTQTVCEFEGLDFKKYVLEILELVKSFLVGA